MSITDLSIFKPTSFNNSILSSNSGKIFHNSNTNIRNMVWNYHYRMGHPSSATMCNAITGDTPAVINSNLLASDIRNIFSHEHCIHCILYFQKKTYRHHIFIINNIAFYKLKINYHNQSIIYLENIYLPTPVVTLIHYP